MTKDNAWLAMIERLYGKEYAEKLLREREATEPASDSENEDAE